MWFFSGEVEICLDGPTFYGIISYAVGVTAILGMFGIKVGRRFFRKRADHPSSQETAERQPAAMLALESAQAVVDLATERRAPPPPARCQEEELFFFTLRTSYVIFFLFFLIVIFSFFKIVSNFFSFLLVIFFLC
jgi:hypothetical protein